MSLPPSSPCSSLLLLLLFLLVSHLFPCCLASAGDRDPQYQQCVSTCTSECPLLHFPLTNLTFPSPSISPDGRLYAPAVPLSLPLRLTLWSCESDCRYSCMRLHEAWMTQRGWDVVKYHGKWPFQRVWGLQELLSVLFSLGNLLPHAYYAFQYRRRVSRRYSMRNWWTAYALISCNTVSQPSPPGTRTSSLASSPRLPRLLTSPCGFLSVLCSGCGVRCSTRATCC